MGSYNRHNWTSSSSSPQFLTLSNYKAWLDSLGCSLITTRIEDSTLYIHVDDAAIIYFGLNSSSGTRYNMGYQLQGVTTSTSVANDYGGNVAVVCFSDDVFYLQHKNNYSNDRKSLFVYEKLNNKRYFMGVGGYTDGDTNSWYNVQGKEFKCLETGVDYFHESRLKYTQALNYIDYTYDHLLLSGGEITNIEDTNFASCSTVDLNRVITFNDQNFYTIGTNILFPID